MSIGNTKYRISHDKVIGRLENKKLQTLNQENKIN